MGATPVGSLLAGMAAGRIGAPYTLLLGGGVCLAGGLLFRRRLPSLREEIRPIYARLGIIPETAMELQTAVEPAVPLVVR
jgi:hypothetical protein